MSPAHAYRGIFDSRLNGASSAPETLFSFAGPPIKNKSASCVTLLLVPPANLERCKSDLPRARRARSRRSWRSAQKTLPNLPLPNRIVTPLMGKILDIVKRISSAKNPMPTNAEMAEMLGRGRQSIAKAFDKLVAQRRLRLDVKHGLRRVYVVQAGTMTGWGEHRPGHAPFCKNPRGTPADQIIRHTPERIGRAEGFGLLGIPTFQYYAYQHAVLHSPVDAAPARQCQWIVSSEEIYIPEFCGARSMPGKSWCAEHLREVFSV